MLSPIKRVAQNNDWARIHLTEQALQEADLLLHRRKLADPHGQRAADDETRREIDRRYAVKDYS